MCLNQYSFLFVIDIRKTTLMRYTERFNNEAIPEWKSCYINYEHLKVLVKLLRDSVRERLELESMLLHGTSIEARTQKTISLKFVDLLPDKVADINGNHEYFVAASTNANGKFAEAYQENMKVYSDFVNWKYKEIQTNFYVCWKAHFMMEDSDRKIEKQFTSYVEYLFVESFYLSRMVQTNTEAECRMLAKHKLYATGVFPTPDKQVPNVLSIDEAHKLRRQIERFYFRISKQTKQKNRFKLRKLAEEGFIENKESLIIGLLVGAVISVIVFMSIILSRSSVSLDKNTIFNKDFTLWRGISIFIFYIWVLGVDFSFFEKYKISHRIIFKNNYPEYPTSIALFKIAGIFSILFITTFTIYSLQIAGLLEIGVVYSQWLPLFVWGPFLIFLFNPLPVLYPYGRLFFFKLIFNAIASVVIVVDFPKIFVTAQAISLVNVFQDLFYAVCFYTTLSFPIDPTVNTCKTPAIQARFIYTIVIYSIRIIQCIKVGCGQGSYWKKSQFLNSIKFTLALLTAILAYVWKQANQPSVFPAWVVFAVINTLFSFLWDTKIGWDLLDTKSKNCCLRDELIYPKRNYYIWTFVNFLLRSAWTLNISPSVVRQFIGSPEVFNLALGFLEIGRRGMWNLLRVEVQQIRNNSILQALSKEKGKLQKDVYNFVKTNNKRLSDHSIENLIQSEKVMIQVNQQSSEELSKQKEQVLARVKKLKELFDNQKPEMVDMSKQNSKAIKYLLTNVYN